MQNNNAVSTARQMLNKVPEVTLFFWIVKVLSTTVGKTGADFTSKALNIGLARLTLIFAVSLVASPLSQLKSRQYLPGTYWLTVVLTGIVGTLITNDMTYNYEVSLEISAVIFTALFAVTFAIWYQKERTLSIHAANTTKRETYCWICALFTFSLGTATCDLLSESLEFGYLAFIAVFGVMVAVVAIARFGFNIHTIAAFWIAYALTLPLAASIGDYVSQGLESGGLVFETEVTSVIFLVTILATIAYLAVTKIDVIRDEIPAIKQAGIEELR